MTTRLVMQLSILTLLKLSGQVKLVSCDDHTLTAWQPARKRRTLDTAHSPCTELHALNLCTSLSSEANNFPAIQEIPAFYGTSRFITECTPAHPSSLCSARSISQRPSYCIMIHFNIIPTSVPLVFQVASFLQGSPTKSCVHLSSSPYMPHAPRLPHSS